MRTHLKAPIIILLISLFFSCQQGNKIDSEFYIPVEKSKLYVRVIGNSNKPLLINLHGGPGAFSGFDHQFNKKYLEDNYLIAYLDQRGGGKSEESTDSTMLTMKQFVQDLDVVVDTLKSKYNSNAVNLIGSSWGGTLGLLYLINHQDKINSFVCVSGKADGIYPIYALIEHERALADSLFNKSENSLDKSRYKEILEKLSEIEKSDFNHFFDDMNLIKHQFPKELGFNPYWANLKAQQEAVELGNDSTYYTEAHYTKEEFDMAIKNMEFVNRAFRNTPSYNHLNIFEAIAVINKPVLILQGEYDYAIGPKQGMMIYDALKKIPKEDKEIHIIPNAAHNLNLENEDLYFKIVRSFLDKHNNL